MRSCSRFPETPGHYQIRHPIGAQTDQPGAGCVDGDKVLSHHEAPTLRASHDRTVLHADDAVDDRRPGLIVAARSQSSSRSHGSAAILRPAVDGPRNHAEQVLLLQVMPAQ
jgi:hypothetical protein